MTLHTLLASLTPSLADSDALRVRGALAGVVKRSAATHASGFEAQP